MEKKDNIFISELKHHISSNASTTKARRFKRTKLMGKISPISLVILAAGVSLALLTGLLANMYFVQTSGDITLHGTSVPLFLYDGDSFTGRFVNTTVDVTELSAGDFFTAEHTLENIDEGYWEISFTDPTAAFRNVPSDIFYGFNWTVTQTDGTPIPDPFLIDAGTSVEFLFNYSLNREFVEAPEPLAFFENMTIERYNMLNPIALNDSASLGYNSPLVINALSNDSDPNVDTFPLTIIAVQPSDGTVTLEIINDGQQIRATSQYAGSMTVNRWYTISNGYEIATGYLILSLHT